MPSFSVVCSCGAGLCRQSKTSQNYGGNLCISIEPCERCLQKREDAGYEKGYKRCEDDKK